MSALSKIMSKPEGWHEARRLGIGGSDAKTIMSGEWFDLWQEKTGRKEPEDLSGNLAVVMGTFTEPLNIAWFEAQTGIQVRDNGLNLIHPEHPFMRANLDGIACEFPDEAVFEAKHVNAFTKDDELVDRYFWQCQHLMAVSGLNACYLSAFFGSAKYGVFRIERDDSAIADLIGRCRDFWGHVERDEAPTQVESAAPVAIAFDAMIDVDCTGNNAWASAAHDWLTYQDAAKAFDAAAKTIKEITPSNAKKATGHGITVTRSKAGALSIKREK